MMDKPSVQFHRLLALFDNYIGRVDHKDRDLNRQEEIKHRRAIQSYLRRRGVRLRQTKIDPIDNHQR